MYIFLPFIILFNEGGFLLHKLFKNYRSTIILLLSIILGSVAGLVFKQDASVVKPLGDLFLNLLYVVIVPLVFLTITTSIASMAEPKRLSKIIRSIVIIFVITSVVAVAVGIASSFSFEFVKLEDRNTILQQLDYEQQIEEEKLDIIGRTIQLICTNDFYKLMSKDNIIAIVVFAILFAFALRATKEKGKPTLQLLQSLNSVIMEFMKIIMYYAPIGIGCYCAYIVGTFGDSIAVGYLKTFVWYLIVSVAYYFVFYTIYAYIAGKKKGVKLFWKNIITPTFTALTTCSSAATIPVNIVSCKKMGVPSDIAETIVPMGTSFHKDGSIIRWSL